MSELESAKAVLAEIERHGEPFVKLYYGSKLREALGVTGPLECRCGTCVAMSLNK